MLSENRECFLKKGANTLQKYRTKFAMINYCSNIQLPLYIASKFILLKISFEFFSSDYSFTCDISMQADTKCLKTSPMNKKSFAKIINTSFYSQMLVHRFQDKVFDNDLYDILATCAPNK